MNNKNTFLFAKLLSVFFVFSIAMAITFCTAVRLPSYDGAMTLNLAQTFTKTGKYAYWYNSWFYFPSQTDGIFVLISSVIIKIFGLNIVTAQIPNIIFFYISILGLFYVISQFNNGILRYIVPIILIFVPGFDRFGFSGYGELPVFSLAMIGIWIASIGIEKSSNKLSLISGFIFGLAFTIKVMSIFFIAPLSIITILYCFFHRIKSIYKIIYASLSLIAFPVIWEIFRYAQLGRAGYQLWWKLQLQQILVQSGGSGLLKNNWLVIHLHNLHNNLIKIAGFWGVGPYAFTIFLSLLIIGYFFVRFYKIKSNIRSNSVAQDFILDYLALTLLFYIMWWLLILPPSGAWVRRAFALNLVFVSISACIYISLLEKYNKKIFFRIILILFMFSSMIIFLRKSSVLLLRYVTEYNHVENRDKAVFRASLILSELPKSAKIFGIGWWQAPQIALFSGRRINNFNHWLPQEINMVAPFYLVSDSYATNIASKTFKDVVNSSAHQIIFNHYGIKIWRINKYYGIPAQDKLFIRPDRNTAIYSKINQLFGVYSDNWARPISRYIVDVPRDRFLKFRYFVPNLEGKFVGIQRTMKFSLKGCGVISISVVTSGLHSVLLPTGCAVKTNGKIQLTVRSNFMMPHLHQIDADNRPLSYVFEGIYGSVTEGVHNESLSRQP